VGMRGVGHHVGSGHVSIVDVTATVERGNCMEGGRGTQGVALRWPEGGVGVCVHVPEWWQYRGVSWGMQGRCRC